MARLLWKRMNLNPEATEWGRQMQERLELALSRQDRYDEAMVGIGKVGTSGSNTALTATTEGRATREQVDINTADIAELKQRAGLPATERRMGSALIIDANDEAAWVPNVAGLVPEYAIRLEAGNAGYSVYGAGFGQDLVEQGAVPPLTFVDNGTNFYSPVWDVDSDDGDYAGFQPSADIRVHVKPHVAGETFVVAGALDTGFVNNQPQTRNVTIFNESYDFPAELRFNRSSGLPPSIMYGDGSARIEEFRVLRPRERIAWRAWTPSDSTMVWNVEPGFDDPNNGQWGNYEPRFPLDFWYWQNVWSCREMQSFTGGEGDLAPTTGTSKLVNQRNQWLRIGKIAASVGSASSGSPVRIDVKIDGVSVFASLLEIPAGSTSASKEPDAFTHPNAGGYYDNGFSAVKYAGLDSVLWKPGQAITVDIADVGSSSPGTDLTVQLYYG